MLDNDVRAGLEHRPQRKPFTDVDETACAAALAGEFAGGGYLFPGRDGRGIWWALRLDGEPALSGRWPDELRSAVMADYAANPARPA